MSGMPPKFNLDQLSIGWYTGLTKPAAITPSDFADQNRWLSTSESPQPGKWVTDRNPPMREILDCMDVRNPTTEVAFMSPIQWGKTEIGNNAISYFSAIAPGPIMMLRPTVGMGKRWSRQRFKAMIANTPILKKLFPEEKSRDAGNTLLTKEFPGGIIVIVGANAAADLSDMPVRYLIKDEVDRYPLDVDKEGSPGDLANGRTSRFGRRKKILDISTPTTEGLSAIQRSYNEGDQSRCYVPCPHCGEMQTLEWDNLKFTVTDEDTASDIYIACIHNGCVIRNSSITQMLEGYEWRPTAKPKKENKRSFWLNGLYLPSGGTTWHDIVTEYLVAKNIPEKMKTWENVRLAKAHKETVNEITAADLRALAKPYKLGIIPEGGLILFAAADTQDSWQDIDVYAVGRDEQMWHIDNHKIHQEPGSKAWEKEMDDYLLIKTFPHTLGGELRITATNIDSGGHYTQEVYNYCRSRKNHGIHAIRGASSPKAALITRASLKDVNFMGRTIKSGIKLWNVGVFEAKKTMHRRMISSDESPGRVFFSQHLPLAFFEGLTCEKLVRKYDRGGNHVYSWFNPPGARNEPFDNLGYVYHAVVRSGAYKYSEAKWQQLEDKRIASTQADMFSANNNIKKTPSKKDTPQKAALNARRKNQFTSRSERGFERR